MSPRPSPEQQARNDRVDRMVELFMAGHSLDGVCEQGVSGGWGRDDVLLLVEQRGWPLDRAGRIPFRMRPRPVATPSSGRRRTDVRRTVPAVGPAPVAGLPANLERVASWAATADKPTVRVNPPRQQGRSPIPAGKPSAEEIRARVDEMAPRVHEDGSINAQHVAMEQTLRTRHGHPGYIASLDGPGKFRPEPEPRIVVRQEAVGESYHLVDAADRCVDACEGCSTTTQTPTEGTAPGTIGADAAGTAPDPTGPGHGIAGPDAQPQVSPSRSHTGEGGELGASDAPAEPTAAGRGETAPSPSNLELLTPATEPEDWAWDPVEKCYVHKDERTPPVAVRPAVDVLQLGLEHPHPAVRAKAQLVAKAVDALCAALARHRA